MAAVEGAAELVALLSKGAASIDPLMGLVVEKSATDLVGLIQQNASNRPGPRAPTGDYRGSFGEAENNDVEVKPGEYTRTVGTNRAQAARLEYGYVGTDSLGRTYAQDPLPHVGPAADVIEPLFEAAMAKVAEQAVKW